MMGCFQNIDVKLRVFFDQLLFDKRRDITGKKKAYPVDIEIIDQRIVVVIVKFSCIQVQQFKAMVIDISSFKDQLFNVEILVQDIHVAVVIRIVMGDDQLVDRIDPLFVQKRLQLVVIEWRTGIDQDAGVRIRIDKSDRIALSHIDAADMKKRPVDRQKYDKGKDSDTNKLIFI